LDELDQCVVLFWMNLIDVVAFWVSLMDVVAFE
jgi:hypothetical protein